MEAVPASHRDLLKDEIRSFAYLATVMPDGSPQVTPVWFNMDGDNILLNSATGRVKDRNMRSRPQIALAIQDPHNAYRYLQVRGRVVEVTTEGARRHIDILAKKYTGRDVYANYRGEQRVRYRIDIQKVSVMG